VRPSKLSSFVLRRDDEGVSEVEVSGLRIGYERKGMGPPLVLLHGGFGFDSRSWRRQIDALADEYMVVAWDAPGCGRSTDPPPTFALTDYADCLAGFIAALGLSRPHVLGISFGGALALQLFDRHPALPRTLTLAGAYAGWAGSLPPDEVDRRVARLAADMQLPPEEWIPSYLPGLLTEEASPEMVEEVKSLMSAVRPATNQTMLQAMAQADLRDVLSRVNVPTLLLYGEHDVRSPVDVGRALHASISGSSLVILPGVGHFSSVEAAEHFNREVRFFLENNRD
jgi:pimeloyl-ACP methyl ester carboxylesterase